MKSIHRMSAPAVLMLSVLAPWTAMAQSSNPDESTAKISPGSVTPPQDAAAGSVSSQSADAMRPAAHEASSGKAKKLPSSKKPKAVAVPAPKPVASSDIN